MLALLMVLIVVLQEHRVHPLARSALDATSEDPEAALRHAEDEKWRRYPPREGRSVTACAVLTTGAIGTVMQRLMSTLAAAVQCKRATEGLPGKRVAASWRGELSRALARWTGQCVMLSRREVQACTDAC